MKTLFESLPLILIAVPACASNAGAPDEVASDSAIAAIATDDASTTDGASTYFSIAADVRRCSFPTCGGWNLERLNRATTKCANGALAESCYTPVLDWSEAKLSARLRTQMLDACADHARDPGVYVIVRGRFARRNFTTPRPELGRFIITEAWVNENNALTDGTFVRIRDNGVRCFAAPCPSWTQTALNTGATNRISGVDFTPAALTDDEVQACTAELSGRDGLLMAGVPYTFTVNGTTATGMAATAAFQRLSDTP